MAKEGRGQISGHGAAGNTNKRPLQPLDNSDDDNTHKPFSQPNSSNSPKKDTDGAESGSKEKVEGTGCTHYKTVWGLRLDLLLLTIVIAIATVRFKTPLGEQQVVIGNPDIQKQLVYLHEGYYKVKNQLEHLKSEVNKNSDKNNNHRSCSPYIMIS
ncbi:uncharacterized protein LOC128234456 [Mya arenaria]|uniref:uncharacterized protein LOC128234456 n=1 Tax=Mya arenaria TaxID=6604 RepID=UPI0022E3F221|nr:uncharacterized protein LOC128234456 [Mya arenaria]